MDNLTEDQLIEAQVHEILDEAEQLNEFLPLIPLAIWAGGAAWTAYDVYRTAKEYNAGEITKGEVAKRIGTDVALSIAGGAIAKGLVKGSKVGYRMIKKVVDKSKEKFDIVDRANTAGRTAKEITIGGKKIVDPTKVTSARGADGKIRALTKAEKKALAKASDTRSTVAKAIDAIAAPIDAVKGLNHGGLDRKMGDATSSIVKKITDPLMKKKNMPTVAIDPLTKKFKKLDGPQDDRTNLAKVIGAPKAGLDAIRKVDDFIGDIPGNIARKTIDTVTQNPIAKAEKARRKAARQIRAADRAAARAAKEIDKQMQQASDLRKRDATQRIRSADSDAVANAAKNATRNADEFKRSASSKMRSADAVATSKARQAADKISNDAKRRASAVMRKADNVATDRASDVAAFKRNADQRTATARIRGADNVATKRADDANDKRRAASNTIRNADSAAIKKAKEIEIAAKKKRADAILARAARKADANARIKKADANAAKRAGKTDAEIAARIAARRAARKSTDGNQAKRIGRRIDNVVGGGGGGSAGPMTKWNKFQTVQVADPLNLSRASKG